MSVCGHVGDYTWTIIEAKMTILHKKRDTHDIEKYRPISVPSHVVHMHIAKTNR